jgi:hypothetical protein
MTDTNRDAATDVLPYPPRAPEPEECCRSGCEPCVYDLYWDALARYEEALKRWEARHGPLDKSG